MKKLMIIALVLLSSCTASVKVENEAKGSEYQMTLIAVTPEGVNVYRIVGNGYVTNVAVNPKTGDVSVAMH